MATQAAEWTGWWAEQAARLGAGTAAERLAARQGFVLTKAQALEAGMSCADVRRQTYNGRWWSPRRGVLATVAVYAGDGDSYLAVRRRFALGCTAAAVANPGHTVSGSGAAVLLGLPLYREPVTPQLTAPPPNTPGHRAATLVRPAGLRPGETSTWFGIPITTAARTVVDLARHGRRDGLVAGDAALREFGLTPTALDTAVRRASGWPGIRRARRVLQLADARAESPLESITRLACLDAGLPDLDLQVEIYDPELGRCYRVDGLWRTQRLVLEADGRVKYTGDELWQEKIRQERLEQIGYRLVRVTWRDVVSDWPRALARIHRLLAAALPPSPTE